MQVHPRHRGDCADFFSPPECIARMDFDGPVTTISAIEYAAARAGRTWNEQFLYVMTVCLGRHRPDFDDGRSVEDWRTLLGDCRFRLRDGEDWRPCTCLWWQTAPAQVEA